MAQRKVLFRHTVIIVIGQVVCCFNKLVSSPWPQNTIIRPNRESIHTYL